jgi:peptidyl-prolyl cis-trans isomerase D
MCGTSCAAPVAHDRALDIAYERANRVEDALAGGTPLAEVAERFGLTLTDATLDANGRNQENAAVTLPVAEGERPALLRAIFAARQGDAPRMTEMGNAFVAIQIREIVPPRCDHWRASRTRSPPPI